MAGLWSEHRQVGSRVLEFLPRGDFNGVNFQDNDRKYRKYSGTYEPYGGNLLCTGPVSRSHYLVDTSYVFGSLRYFMYKLHEKIMLVLVNCKIDL